MDKNYEPKSFEKDLYNHWLEKGYFKARINKNKKPFTIIMPPPNITSKLHMGHAFQETIQDIIIRRKRMQGYEALWLPGTDHAAISTEAMVVNKLAKQGLTKEMLGREKFMEHIYEWYDQYKNTIINQFKQMGFSCDWDRLAFTMDEQNCRAVRQTFVYLYKKGWIYKGKRIVNWCPHCKSSISDAEVEFKDVASHFWHIRYQIEGTNDYIEIATTRPETMLGDTAVAVNPNDKRYTKLIGKNVILPIVNKPIPIIADDYVEMDFGTGMVKITPAHDPNDFEIGVRHNLEVVKVIDEEGKMNENAGKFCGMTREEARDAVVEELKKLGNLVKIEDYSHNVGHCERCKTIIEPLISSQWFVKMSELAKPAIEVVENNKVRFVDEQYKKSYLHWMYNINDWCISRQRYFGVPFPVWYCKKCGHPVIADEKDLPVNPLVTSPKISACPVCGHSEFEPETDVMDTWATSSVTPLINMHYGETQNYENLLKPMSLRTNASEIIRTWDFYTIVKSFYHFNQRPWDNVMISGFVMAGKGEKIHEQADKNRLAQHENGRCAEHIPSTRAAQPQGSLQILLRERT